MPAGLLGWEMTGPMGRGLLAALLAVSVGCGGQKHQDYMGQGLDYLTQNDIKKAFEYFKKAIDQDPSNYDNYLIVGQAYLRLGFSQKAVYVFAAAARVDPGNGDAYFFLALSHRARGNITDAVKCAAKSAAAYARAKNAEQLQRSLVLLKSLRAAE